MNIGRATFALAEQTPIHIADAGTTRSGPSVNAYKEGLRHQWYRNTALRVLTRCQQQTKDGESKSKPQQLDVKLTFSGRNQNRKPFATDLLFCVKDLFWLDIAPIDPKIAPFSA
jgi:hypothetical protein